MKIYSVWDKCMESFAPPFVAKNDNVAVRNFLIGAKKLPNVDDLKLYCLGDWNDENDTVPFNPHPSVEVPINMGSDNE